MRYEDNNMSNYLNNSTKGMIFMHPENTKSSQNMSAMSKGQVN